MKLLLHCSLLASITAAAALNTSHTPSSLALNGATTAPNPSLTQWPPAPWIIPIDGPLSLFIHAYGSRPPPSIPQDTILTALQIFMDRILSTGRPNDYYPPTILGYSGVQLGLVRSRELEALRLTRRQAAAVVQNLFVRTRDGGGMEITDAEILDDGVVVRSLVLRFYGEGEGGRAVG